MGGLIHAGGSEARQEGVQPGSGGDAGRPAGGGERAAEQEAQELLVGECFEVLGARERE